MVGKNAGYLKGAHILHRVDIGDRELVTRDERIDPLQGGLEVSVASQPWVRVVGEEWVRTSSPIG